MKIKYKESAISLAITVHQMDNDTADVIDVFHSNSCIAQTINDVVEETGLPRSFVAHSIREMCKSGVIIKSGHSYDLTEHLYELTEIAAQILDGRFNDACRAHSVIGK